MVRMRFILYTAVKIFNICAQSLKNMGVRVEDLLTYNRDGLNSLIRRSGLTHHEDDSRKLKDSIQKLSQFIGKLLKTSYYLHLLTHTLTTTDCNSTSKPVTSCMVGSR